MRVVQQRLLRGANLYSRERCLLAVIEAGDASDAVHAAQLGLQVAQTMLQLQRACGHQLSFLHAEADGGGTLRQRIVVQYELEHVAQAALAVAVSLAAAGTGTEGESAGFTEAVARLRLLAVSLELPPAARELMREARAAGIPVQRVSEHADLLQIGWGARQWRYAAAAQPDTRLLTHAILRDRHLRRIVLEQAMVAVPDGAAVTTLEDALRVGRRLGWNLRLGLTRRGEEDGADRFCDSESGLRAAFEHVRRAGAPVDLEVLEPGERFEVRLCAGEAQHPSPEVRQACSRAATALGLRDAEMSFVQGARGEPLLCDIRDHDGEDGEGGSDGQAGAVANDAGTLLQQTRDAGQEGRIPIIAVTGTNGKTTTTLMISHAVRLKQLRTGCASTQGLALDGALYQRGDCTGYWSHRSVLDSPATEFAVLETARGGLLKRGLAFDRCTIGVLLNVSDDHLGLDGIDTVEQLARVKSLVVAAAQTAVLNAEDVHCVAAKVRLAHDAQVMFFAMDARNPVLQAHLAQGGDAVWLENEIIMLRQRGISMPVLAADAMPASMGGLARFNIANGLAATAALAAAGFTAAHIGMALASFVSDAATNPLRSNVFHVGGLSLVLDYAHNPAAYAALGTLARGLARGRVRAVVTSPGDRRDIELQRTGAACAAAFDQLFVYESASRGRRPGEAAQLIAEGARTAGAGEVVVHDAAAVALQSAYRASVPGDVLVFACGTAVETLVEAIRAIDPPAADEIELQRGATPAAVL